MSVRAWRPEIGTTYEVIGDGFNFVGRYLGRGGPTRNRMQFDCRPTSGTTTVSDRDVLAMWTIQRKETT